MGTACLSIASSFAVDGGLGGAAVSTQLSTIDSAAVTTVADGQRAFSSHVVRLHGLVWIEYRARGLRA